MAWSRELEVAREALCRAGEAALRYWRDGVAAEAKQDLSPVTAADRHCERLIVQELCQHFPDDGVLGEEGANKPSATGRKWIVDPIDGTRDFVRQNRLWCQMVALEEGGETVLGVIHFPALEETYWATRRGGAFRNGEPIRVSSIGDVSQAVLCVNSFTNIHRSGFSRNLMDWMRHFWAVRSMGGAWDAMFVSAGHAEAWIEQSAQPWDLAALQVIAEEAGARFFNFDGGRSIYGGNCVLCVPALETVLRRFVAG
jgi:histidinol phosphatase-like enzyme (inositol monophosphatase family)